MLSSIFQNKIARFFRMFCLTIFSLLVLAANYSDLHAFETGDQFVPHNLASRFMERYEQMGNNEHITYPARVFDMEVTDAKAEEILEHLSVTVSYMTESMYNHYGFMVKSVTFTLEANGDGPSTSGDPMPLNIALDHGWGMGYANNWLNIPKNWVLNPDYTSFGIFHEFAHHFLLRHLDLNDGYYPRSTMDTPGGDVPSTYNRWGGDDLAGALHMWRYTDDPNALQCPEFYTLSTVGATGQSYPDAEPYPAGTWRCDPDKSDRYGLLFQNKADGRCLEGSGSSAGTTISLSACNNDDIEQQWDLLPDDDGAFRIVNVASDMCMQVKDSSLSSGAMIELQECNTPDSEDATQKFYMIADGSGHYSLRAELSGQVCEVSGNNVIQKKPNGTSIQRWSIASEGANLALGKPTSQSSTGHGGISSRAVDGNTNGSYWDGSVTHTASQSDEWWKVDLGSACQVNRVTLWNRTDCCSNRLSNFHVDLLDVYGEVIKTQNYPGTAGNKTDINISASGVYSVRVQLNGRNLLSLAEVQVFGGSNSSSTGKITRQVWTGISGTSISLLTSNANYPNNPTITDELTTFEAPTDWADNYGTRIVGYIHPQTSGTYTFWIASDDNGELWLSTDDSADNKQRIAYVPGWTNARQWNRFDQQRSAGISLTAGKRYFVEALQKEHGGGDNLAVAWQGPGVSQAVIPGSYLSPYNGSDVEPRTYALTVKNGIGSGNYKASTEVSITADRPLGGIVFDKWVVENGGALVADVNSATTTVTMPDNDATVTATYKDLPPTNYALTVNSGSGAGSYVSGARITITADNAPSGMVFDRWVVNSGSPSIASLTSASTKLTMPARAAIVTATYKNSNVSLRDPENPANTVNGLDYNYYSGSWNVLPNFAALNPTKTGTVNNYSISEKLSDDNFGFVFKGYINVPTDGMYIFYTSSDDGSKLYIGNTAVVNNDGLHPSQERSGQIGLKAGKHAISVDFFEKTGGEVLQVRYQGPGISRRLITAGSLYRVPQTNASALLTIASDNAYEVYFNGQRIGSGTNWFQAQTYSNLNVQTGNNVIAVKATDAGGVAGLLAELSLNGNRIGTSNTWKASLTAPSTWTSPSLDDSSWSSATEQGGYGVSPWGTNVADMPGDTPAKWIWSSDNQNHNTVYLRYSFNGGSTPPTNKLKVFILAGQSNMEGHGHMYQTQALMDRNGGKGTLEYLTKNPATADTYKHVIDTNGDWVRRNDVWIANLGNNGPLTAGYGAADNFIGPEFQFGHVVGDYYEAPVLIIKTAWGGKSLYEDFRPPSSGGTIGPYYTQMINEVRAVLNNIKQVMPQYDGQGYEITGFGWHQGWNDRINEAAVDEYQTNCVNLINDVRAEFNVSDMPFVIATTGMSGFNETHPRALKLMEAQLAVANDSRVVNGRVFTVETRPFWREGAVSPTDASYHWNHSAETQFLIGNGMGGAMIQLF